MRCEQNGQSPVSGQGQTGTELSNISPPCYSIAGTFSAVDTVDRNTRSDANDTNGRNLEGTTLSSNLQYIHPQ
jgi:hypothetical protein